MEVAHGPRDRRCRNVVVSVSPRHKVREELRAQRDQLLFRSVVVEGLHDGIPAASVENLSRCALEVCDANTACIVFCTRS